MLELTGMHISSGSKVLSDVSLALSHLKHYDNRQIILYSDTMQDDILRKEAVEETLRQVITGTDTTSFTLHFQPLWNVNFMKPWDLKH